MLSPSSAPRALLIMLAVLAAFIAPSACLAENGSAQAVMSLIVLPNDTNIAVQQVESHGVTPSHQEDTSISFLSRTGTKTCRIWITI